MIKSVKVYDDGVSPIYWVEYEDGIVHIYDGYEVDLDELTDKLTLVYSSVKYCECWATYERR